MTRVRRQGRVVLLVAAPLLTAACSVGGELPCSSVGASSGIQVHLPRFRTTHTPVTVTACADDHCVTVSGRAGDGRLREVLAGQDLDSADPVVVRVLVRDSTRHVLFTGRTTATPQKFLPNGPGCEPTAYVGAVHGHGRHTLTVERLGLG